MDDTEFDLVELFEITEHLPEIFERTEDPDE